MDIVSTDLLHQFQINDKQSASTQRNYLLYQQYGAFSHDLTAAILVFQNNQKAVILGYQTNPVEAGLFSYVNTFFCSDTFAWLLFMWVKTLYGTAISLGSLTGGVIFRTLVTLEGGKLTYISCRVD